MGPTTPKMESGPPKMMQAVIAILLPPACREEVLGDLHERYRSPGRYRLEAIKTVPLVILSRIRRTTDPGLLFMCACALYLSFVAVAWVSGEMHFLIQNNGYAKLAVPVVTILLSLVLVDAYARPERRIVVGMVAASFVILLEYLGTRQMTFSSYLLIVGGNTGVLFVSGLRMLFAPGDNQTRGAG